MPNNWFSLKCAELGGTVSNNVCMVNQPYSYCIPPTPKFLINMDTDITNNREWWWFGYFVLMILVPAIFYPIYGWNVINWDFGVTMGFLVLYYGRRITRTWRILIVIVIIFEIWYLGLLFYTVIFTGTWYPVSLDFYGHASMGFILYFAFSAILPRRHFFTVFVISVLAEVIYEFMEWACAQFMGIPMLWWNFDNAVFDVTNNMIGGLIAIFIEYLIRKNTKC